MAFSPDSQTLASSSYDRTIKLWYLQSGQLLHTLAGHNKTVWSVAFSPDGQTLASGSANETIKLWSMSAVNKTLPKPKPLSPSQSQLDAIFNTQPEVTDNTQLYQLNRKLYDLINQAWQKRSASQQHLVYRVGINQKGVIVAYQPVSDVAKKFIEQTPLGDLLSQPINNQATTSELIGQFKVVFTSQGILEVSPWRGYTAKLQSRQ